MGKRTKHKHRFCSLAHLSKSVMDQPTTGMKLLHHIFHSQTAIYKGNNQISTTTSTKSQFYVLFKWHNTAFNIIVTGCRQLSAFRVCRAAVLLCVLKDSKD